jgi:two-component system, LytTR family, sensor kinase
VPQIGETFLAAANIFNFMRNNQPVIKTVRRWLLIFFIYTLAALFFSSNYALQNQIAPVPISFARAFSIQLASLYAWFSLTPLIIFLSEKFPLRAGEFARNLPIHLSASVVFVLIKQAADAFTYPWLGFPLPKTLESYGETYLFLLFLNSHWNYFIYAVIVGAIHGVNYYKKLRETDVQTAQLKMQLAQSNLRVLQMQLHPHFLFNTHNAIATLIHKNPKMAEKMLMNLSDLLRISIKKMDVQEVPLQTELEFLNKYLEIEKIRFQNRLQVTMNIAAETLDAAVPNMILQPLVENAIKHGIAPLARGGEIKIEAARQNGHLNLIVSDNGVGMNFDEVEMLTADGIGLANTKARLDQLYKDRATMQIESVKNCGLEVKMEIPFRAVAKTEPIITDVKKAV